jgi:VanZ family protein
MTPSKIISTLTVAFFGFIIWIIYLANTGQNSIFFDFVGSIPYGDKVGHFCLFGFLALGANFACKLKHFRVASFNIYVGSILVLVFASIEELSQHFIPNRTLDISDFVADCAGLIVFSIITSYLSKYTRHKTL